MALIGSIALQMSAGTEKFSRDMKVASKVTDGFASQVSRVQIAASGFGLPSFGKILAGLGVSAAVRQMAAFARSSLESVDALDEAAGQIGTTAGELGKLRYVAKLTGTETESLDAALQKMTANLGDAVNGVGPAAKALRSLDLNVRRLAEADPADAFFRIASAIAALPAPAQRAAAAMDVFGRGGIAVLNTINAGPEKLSQLAKEAERLGLAINSDDVSKIAAANDAMDRLSFAVSGLGNALATSLAPAVTWTIESVTDFISDLQMGEGVVGSFTGAIRDWGDYALVAARGIATGFRVLGTVIFGTVENIGSIIGTIPANLAIVGRYVAENWRELIVDGLNAVTTAFHNFGENIGKLAFSVWEWIQNPFGEFKPPDFTPILDGFKATAAELPDLIRPVLRDIGGEVSTILWGQVGQQMMRQLTPAIAQAKKAAVNLGDPGVSKLAGLAERNSKEAYSAVANLRVGGGKAADQTARNTSNLVETSKKQLEVLGKIATQAATGSPLPVFSF